MREREGWTNRENRRDGRSEQKPKEKGILAVGFLALSLKETARYNLFFSPPSFSSSSLSPFANRINRIHPPSVFHNCFRPPCGSFKRVSIAKPRRFYLLISRATRNFLFFNNLTFFLKPIIVSKFLILVKFSVDFI